MGVQQKAIDSILHCRHEPCPVNNALCRCKSLYLSLCNTSVPERAIELMFACCWHLQPSHPQSVSHSISSSLPRLRTDANRNVLRCSCKQTRSKTELDPNLCELVRLDKHKITSKFNTFLLQVQKHTLTCTSSRFPCFSSFSEVRRESRED